MIPTTAKQRRSMRVIGAAGAAAALVLGLAACDSSDSSDDASASGDSQNSELAATVKKLSQPLDEYPVPEEKLSELPDVSGETLYYIPITQQSPQFAVTEATVKQAAKTLDMKVQVCDGKGTPTDVSSCVKQATKADAASIILDAVSYDIASNAIDSAQSADIPVVISNQVADDAHPASDTFTYAGESGSDMDRALASWVSLDSDGDADVLINQSTDGPSPEQFVKAGQEVYDEHCPDCTITINKVSSANFDKIPSSTSSALLKNPNVEYVESQFEQYLQATKSGIQQAGKTSDVKTVTAAAQLSGLKELSNKSFLHAAAAPASAYQGWVDVDAALRLIAGDEIPDYTIPVRLFTQDTIGDVTLTEDAEISGEWFGPTDFPEQFQDLWGIA